MKNESMRRQFVGIRGHDMGVRPTPFPIRQGRALFLARPLAPDSGAPNDIVSGAYLHQRRVACHLPPSEMVPSILLPVTRPL